MLQSYKTYKRLSGTKPRGQVVDHQWFAKLTGKEKGMKKRFLKILGMTALMLLASASVVLATGGSFTTPTDGQEVLVGTTVDIEYEMTYTTANRQPCVKVSVEKPDGGTVELSELFGDDSISTSFTADKEGTYKIIGECGQYINMIMGYSSVSVPYYNDPDIISIKVVGAKSVKKVTPVFTCSRNDKGKPVITGSNRPASSKLLVYRADKKDGEYKLIKTTSESSYTDTKAKPLKKYFYKVKYSMTSGGKTYKSKYSAAKVCNPARPAIESERTAKKKVKLTCTNMPDGVKMEVYRATSKSGRYKLIKTVKKGTFTDTSSKAKKVYYYKVRWTAKSGGKTLKSKYSKVLKVDKYIPSQVPEITSVTKTDSGKLKITWRCYKEVDLFYVWISDVPNADNGIGDRMFFLAEKGSSARSAVVPLEYYDYENGTVKLKSGKTYYFYVYGLIDPTADLPTKLHSKEFKYKMP